MNDMGAVRDMEHWASRWYELGEITSAECEKLYDIIEVRL
jgi:hypothetical protein